MTSPTSFHALRFGRAATAYEAAAGVQARMADTLLGLWGDGAAPARVLEFGCGTGLLTRRLAARFPAAAITATDAAPEMLEVARAALAGSGGHLAFRELDARAGSRTTGGPQGTPPDLLASNALVQWFPDLAAHFRFAASLASPGAHYLVSGFDRANFPELNALLSAPPFGYQAFPGHTREAVEVAVSEGGWQVSGFVGWEEVEVLPTPRAVLARVQDLGAVRDPRAGGRMTRANLAWLLAEYAKRFSAEGGVRLTWKPWAAVLSLD
ncbi:MAG TPA: methyltransferase [Fibrobacteria bacterium]|nr:methyltransferase [Fibrobacteria bacterium]